MLENRNRFVRRDIKKGSDISSFSNSEIRQIEKKMQNYPIAVLNFRTPQKAWDEKILKRYQNKKLAEKLGNVKLKLL